MTDPSRDPDDWTRSPARPLAALVLLAILGAGLLLGWTEGRRPLDARTIDARHTTNTPSPAARLIDVNRASPAELDMLPGIGPARAQAIIDERTLGGPFDSLEDLERVKGIGPRTVEKLRGMAVAGAPTPAPDDAVH